MVEIVLMHFIDIFVWLQILFSMYSIYRTCTAIFVTLHDMTIPSPVIAVQRGLSPYTPYVFRSMLPSTKQDLCI